MPNTPHPLDEGVMNLHVFRRTLVRLHSRDGVVCREEQAAQDRYDAIITEIAAYRQRQVAAASFERNGFGRHTNDRMREAGAEIVNLAVVRRNKPRVIAFPIAATPDNEPLDAA